MHVHMNIGHNEAEEVSSCHEPTYLMIKTLLSHEGRGIMCKCT